MSLLADAIDQCERTLATLHAARDHAEDRLRLALASAPADDTAAPPPPDATDAVAETGEPDNELPFKCPGCGATYAEQVECTNGHPAEQTLPTQDVLDGAPPADPSAEPADTTPETNDVIETATTPPPATPAAGGDEGPTWPAGTQ
jgi:hypothetical protein